MHRRVATRLVAASVEGAGLLARCWRPGAAIQAASLTGKVAHVVQKLTVKTNPPTCLSGTPGAAKRTVWTRTRSLSDVRRVGHLEGATLNDVVVAAVSAALARYLVEHGGDPVDLTTMVPVNMRPRGRPLPRELGNRFALVLLELPTGDWPPLQRLSETKRRMDAIKNSPESLITFGLISGIGRTDRRIERLLVDFFSSKAIGVTTNVAGPTHRRFVAGAPLAGALGWVPGSGRQSVGVSIFTYDGTVRVGFKVDARVVPDPEKLVHAFEAELDELVRIGRAA
jgi:WS/DGAT/MGAT family acyltransferase